MSDQGPSVDPSRQPTPQELVDWFTQLPQERQLGVAERWIRESQDAMRCFLMNHEGLQDEVTALRRQVRDCERAVHSQQRGAGNADHVDPIIRTAAEAWLAANRDYRVPTRSLEEMTVVQVDALMFHVGRVLAAVTPLIEARVPRCEIPHGRSVATQDEPQA